jgi:predicted nucleotidyltransferase
LAQRRFCQAAYIFGSVARGETTTASDLDIHVLVDRDSQCANTNHPLINGVKLDLTCLSFAQLAARTQYEIEQGKRVPMVAESTIVFDHTGELTDLRASAQRARPKPCTPADHQSLQFGICHANDKAERLLTTEGIILTLRAIVRDDLQGSLKSRRPHVLLKLFQVNQPVL